MILPEPLRKQLGPSFLGLNLDRVSFILSEPARLATPSCCPHAYVRAGSSPEVGTVFIHPDFWNPGSITTLRLVAHELYHQAQMQSPDFNMLYEEMAKETERLGLPPWKHPMEVPAYRMEEMVDVN